jgi:hypothetical protein
MDGFTIVVLAFIVIGLAIFLAIGMYHPKSGSEVLDWKPTRSHEDEVRLELEDVDQMLEAQNERRRRSGRPELSEDQLQAEVHEEERLREQRARGAGSP